jgi:excisionase family DNA binding protein
MIKSKDNYLTSAEAAQSLGFSPEHVRKLILQGKIKAEKLGRNWIIEKANLENIHRQRFPKHKENVDDGSYE